MSTTLNLLFLPALALLLALGLTADLLSLTPVGVVMLVLITLLGVVILHYSEAYLAGDAGQRRYQIWLLATLAAVAVVVTADHLLLLLAGWTTISLTLHQLLMHYPDRPRAALAAHKKFLLARFAELSLLTAFLLLNQVHGTWSLAEILARYPRETLQPAEHAAAVLIALTALIKCAQLPVHGWLIQAVEAPTPVSALLHAGIINLGGFLLISFAPLFSQSLPAIWMVLVIAGLTSLIATLVMSTRISVKVRLAWSTSGQMGLMLVECALGLYELALLHLVAHACYKAYAFLDAGGAVRTHMAQAAAPGRPALTGDWITGALTGAALAGAAAVLVGGEGPYSPWLLLAVAIAILVAERHGRRHEQSLFLAITAGVVLTTAYLAGKLGAGQLVTSQLIPAAVLADLWVGLLVISLMAGHLLLRRATPGPAVMRLKAWLYAGLYLDEWFTRTTLWLWPARLPIRRNPKRHASLTRETSS